MSLAKPIDETDHVLGPADAPVTLVEYGDFQCPHCRAAAQAAGAQGKFWPMHDLIYENQDLLSPALLTRLGQRLGLDMQRFTDDVASHRFLPKVKEAS